MSTTTNLAFKFLNELHSQDVTETIESLSLLMDHLENKTDPDPIEVQLFESAFQTLEKLKILEGQIKRYVSENDHIAEGSKLQKLYDRKTPMGTSKLFK